MTNDNVVPTKDQVPLQLTVDSNIVGNEKDKSSAQTYLLLQNSTELLTSTQISPTDTLTIVGVSQTNPSQGQIINLETSYNEKVNSIPEKSTLATENIGIATSADSSADGAIAITNDNVVSTTDQVPLLMTKHSNIVDTEKDKSSVTIGSTSIKAPAMTDEVNTSAAVNIQIITNKTDNGVLNTSSDIHLAEQNSAAVMSSQNNLVAENNTPDLISKIKLPELSQSVLNSHKDAATINQETEPLNMKTVMETYDGTGNTVALTENTLTVNPYENHKTIDLIQNNKNSLTVDLSKADSNKLPQTDLNVDFIENTSPVSNRIMITQSVSNVPLHKDTSYNRPIATDKSPSQSPGNTIIKKITQFDCITPDMINLGTTEASTDKTFAETGKVTKIAAPTVTSKDNIQSTIDLNESNIAQSLQNTVTSSPTVLVSTNYNTASIPSTGQVDTVVVADLVNNKPSQSLNIKTVVKRPIPIADITTSEVKTKDISIGSNNRSSIDVNKKSLPHEISLISSATKTVEDLPSLSRNKTAIPTDSVQEIITKHALKDDFINSEKTRDNKATVSVKQLHNLDNVNFKSVSNGDMWTSTGQEGGGQITVQSNSASATHTPMFTVTENLSPNNLGNHQIQNTYTNIYSPPREYSQTTVTKSSSSNYYLGSINSPETMHPKINSDAVKTIYSTLTNIPQKVNIQTASTPHYIIKTTNQNQDTSKQFNAPGTFTLTVNSVSSPSMETLTKHSIQNKIEKIISDQKLISVEQNSDKRIPIANPTAFTTNSNTDEGIKIVSTYNTVNSQNTMPSAILQVSSSYPSLSKKYVNTFQIKNPNDLNKLKASITEYMNNVAKTEGVVPAVETKQSTSNIMSTLGLNSINNRNVTYTTTLHSNSFDRVNPTKPTVNYVIKRIVNDIGPKGVVTTNSENVQNIFENQPLNGFTSGSIRPADNLGTVVVYKQSTVNNPLITESQVLSTKVSSIPTTVLSSGKSSFSTLVPFVSTSSDPTHRIVINSNTPMSQSPLLVKLIKNINSQQDFLSRVKKDQSVTADSNIQYFIKSPKPDSMVETMIFTKEKVNEPFLVSEILGGFRRSNDDSSKTSVQNVVDSKKDDTGSIPNNNERDTNTNPIKLVDINGADTVKDTESDGEGSTNNVGSVKIEENKPSETKSMSKDSTVKPDANIQNKFLPPSPVTSQTNIDNNLTDLKLRREIVKTYPTGAIESVASQGNSQTEALKVNENKHNSSNYINTTSDFQKYPVQLNLENQTDNGSVNIVKRNNNTINDNLVDLTSTNHTVTAYVQSYLNKDGKQGNKTGDELRLNERSMLKANTANVQLNASSKVKSTSTDSPPVFNCTARGRFADKKDCRKFYTCIGNLQPIMGTCPNNTVFSEINKQCTRNLSHCVRNNQFRCLLEGRFSDFFKDNIYYICVRNCTNHFTRYKLQCQDGYHLDKETVRCERDEMTSIQSASSVSEVSNDETTTPKPKSEKIKSSSDDFECEKEGNFPYAKDCRKYYVCTKVKDVYRRKIKKCSKDEMYDKKKKKCVDSDSKEC
ncbi:mucin-4-like [Spodoptera frugiperda]|uniref:Mucin-4-like n=1 Tax=Spodoptera frugiperda TaxID=7108 RepID=A0A9R0E9G8_SPOFR|nr:mucin-4-like [Spodoptera frugiperda]